MDVTVGDQVLFNKYAGTEIKIDGKKVIVLRENEILAIILK
jgi:chaperonin GroES